MGMHHPDLQCLCALENYRETRLVAGVAIHTIREFYHPYHCVSGSRREIWKECRICHRPPSFADCLFPDPWLWGCAISATGSAGLIKESSLRGRLFLAVFDHLDIFKSHQAVLDHFIQMGEEEIDFFFRVDDFDHDWKVH